MCCVVVFLIKLKFRIKFSDVIIVIKVVKFRFNKLFLNKNGMFELKVKCIIICIINIIVMVIDVDIIIDLNFLVVWIIWKWYKLNIIKVVIKVVKSVCKGIFGYFNWKIIEILFKKVFLNKVYGMVRVCVVFGLKVVIRFKIRLLIVLIKVVV